MITLNIYSFFIQIRGANHLLSERLKADFAYFLINKCNSINLDITIFHQTPTTDLLPNDTIPEIQNEKVIKYSTTDQIFYNYHYSVILIEQKNKTQIYSTNLNRLHEIIYLYLLSKSAKFMDLHGLHKIHGFALALDHLNLLFVAPSHGGKSSTFLKLIDKTNGKIFSEDTPVIGHNGRIYPFPLRIGVKDLQQLNNCDPINIYQIKRQEYGTKYLYPITKLKQSIAQTNDLPNFIIFAIRSNQKTPTLKKINILSTFFKLIPHMVIGIGLPIIIEFFLHPELKDLLLRLKILIKRLIASIQLTHHSKAYILLLTEDTQKNIDYLYKKLQKLN